MRNSQSKKVVQNTRGKSSGEKLEKKNSFFIQKHCLCSTITLNLRGFCRGGICRGICRESRTYILDQPVNTCHAQIHSKSVYLLDILSCDLTELVVKKHRIVKYKISHWEKRAQICKSTFRIYNRGSVSKLLKGYCFSVKRKNAMNHSVF